MPKQITHYPGIICESGLCSKPIIVNKMDKKNITPIRITIYELLLSVVIISAIAVGVSIGPSLTENHELSTYQAGKYILLAITAMIFVSGAFLIYSWKQVSKLVNQKELKSTERESNILENISEGVVILNSSENILVANREFLNIVEKHFDEINGKFINSLSWHNHPVAMPWSLAISSGSPVKESQLYVKLDGNAPKTVIVNAIPIKDENNMVDGVIVTVKNITSEIEQKEKFKKTMSELRDTHKKVHMQNEALKKMATLDHLTNCYNRHAFFEVLEGEWSGSKRYGYEMSCILIDVDQLRKINETHGHAAGDEVLRVVAGLLKDNVRKSDYVCRFSGEEFCILLPHTSVEDASQTAEKIRRKVEESHPNEIYTTISMGLVSIMDDAKNPQEMTDQADIAMRYAMSKGCNQHYRWDQLPEDARVLDAEVQKVRPDEKKENEDNKAYFDIPFQTVNSLLNALEQRDTSSGLHCRRVASLCVTAARDLMSQVDCYVLEVAALLHDIGMISVPDELLNKHGRLTEQEQKMVNFHLRMGVETISSSFNSSELVGILKYTSAWYSGTPGHPEMPKGDNIPIRSRIISAASAYDELISGSSYSDGFSPEQAIEELRLKAGTQFDPIVVERIAEVISARVEERGHDMPNETDIKALRIGLELEKLICAVEEEDVMLMSKIAESLASDAAKLEVRNISEAAKVLEAAIERGKPFMELVPLVNKIIGSAGQE